ncbi:efflux transporter outer membrane subunit [Extensimonas sp. H3M7-6]|uniref:efflux transporter outer membrane subunit n=1 Tax=Extensimonas soli TaxID=3031322 RepID=UPI0023DCB84F|nr:TolC family protein [Extensimonas sp. H3M7-6]MDF1481124.1 TolC family protein [Extensimonas sp. H3M7-6]
MKRLLQGGVLALALASMTACTTVGPDYALPKDSRFAQTQQQPLALDARGSSAVDAAHEAVAGRWWKLYDDARLDALVEQALQGNVELRVAAARLAQAQARYVQALALGGVNGNVEAAVMRGRISAESLLQPEVLPVANFANGSLSVSYQLDLFGKLRRVTEAASADAEAVQAASDLARISVVAAVVGAYAEICHGNHELAVARHSLELQQASRQVAARLHTSGRGTVTAVKRADTQVATLQAALPLLQARKQAAAYELAELLGRTPDQVPAEALDCAEAPELKQPIPVGDGAALLRRRPDVRQVERELAAATADVGVATAEMYPDVFIGGSFGANGLLDDFGKKVTQQFTFGPLLSWSIPGRGARARVRGASARADMMLAEFDRVVLQALRETQTILSSYAEDLRHVAALREARDRAEVAAADMRRLYEGGRVPYLASLDAERTLAAAEASLAAAEAQVSKDQIRLFLALGGGWGDQAAGTTEGSASAGGSPRMP